MPTNQLNHGQLLKAWVHHTQIKPKRLLTLLGFKKHNVLYYYYDKEEIKRDMLLKFATALKVPLDQFLAGPPTRQTNQVEEVTAAYGLHHGDLLEKLVEEKNTKISHLAEFLNLSRPTVYGLFEKREFDNELIEKIAKYYNLPTSYFMPGGSRIGQYNDTALIDQLREMEQRQNERFHDLEVMLSKLLSENRTQLEKLIIQHCGEGKKQGILAP